MKYVLITIFIMILLLVRHYIVRHIFSLKQNEDKKIPKSTYENIEIETDIGTIRGWFMKTADAKGSFLLIHGWGSNKSNMLRYADHLLDSGYEVIIVDVPGHGQSHSTKKQVSVATFVQSITSTINFMCERQDINSKAIYVLGHSMGGLAASIVNATDSRIKGLITDSMPTSLKSISQSMAGKVTIPYIPFGWILVSWFLLRGGVFLKARREWRLEKIFKNQQSPALAIHSIHDKKVPISNVDVLLNNSNFKQVVTLETKGHHNCVKDNCFWEEVFRFVRNEDENYSE